MDKEFTEDRAAGREMEGKLFLFMLLLADIAFIAMHIALYFYPFRNSQLFAIDVELSHGEFFQYLKFYWIVLLFLVLCWRTRQLIYAAWASLFLCLLLDDSMALHERGGAFLGRNLGFRDLFGSSWITAGQLFGMGLVGATFSAILLLLYFRSRAAAKRATKTFALLTLGLALSGVVVDALHAELTSGLFEKVLTVVEDGGEMLIASVICWYAAVVASQDGNAPSMRASLFSRPAIPVRSFQ